MILTPVVLLLQASSALSSTEKSLPEPYGHTANIAPHAPNTDREWYTEYRWKKSLAYKPQDGAITDKPKFAPVPKPTATPKKKFLRKPLNKKEEKEAKTTPTPTSSRKKYDTEQKHAKLPKMKPEKAEKEEVKEPKKEKMVVKDTKKKAKEADKAVRPPGVGPTPEKKPTEPRYAVPKPCGHTSQVHPYNWNNDKEWYTEYRWKRGSEYKIQDGPITEKPVGAKKIIQSFPVEADCQGEAEPKK